MQEVGKLPTADFSSDGKIYRCHVAARSEGRETRPSLVNLAPLAVRVHVSNMDRVSNTEKNRRRVEKRLVGGRGSLSMSLDKTGAATFFKNGQEIVFRKSSEQADKSLSLVEGGRCQQHSSPEETETDTEGALPRDSSVQETETDNEEVSTSLEKLGHEESLRTSSDFPSKAADLDYTEVRLQKNVKKNDLKVPHISGRLGSCVTKKPRRTNQEGESKPGVSCRTRKFGKTESVPVQSGSWKEGDEVTTLWEETLTWRRGVLHEISGNSALVVCPSEPLVRAAVVPLLQLRSCLLPLPGIDLEGGKLEKEKQEEKKQEKYREVEQEQGREEEKEQEEYVKEQEKEETNEDEGWVELLSSLLSVDVLCCPSSASLLQLLLPHLSQTQVTPLLHLARLHLTTLALLSPDTLLVLSSSLTEELKKSFTGLLPILLRSESGSILVASLLPHLDTNCILATVSALLQLPRLPALLPRLLLYMTTRDTAAFCILTESILADLPVVLEQEEGIRLVTLLLDTAGLEVTARVAALLSHCSIPGTQQLCQTVRRRLQTLLSQCTE